MAYPTGRVILFDRNMEPLPELDPSEVFSRVRSEEINGPHELVVVTTRRLEEGWRALTVDGTGKWREWVVTEIDEQHQSGASAVGTYHLVWSLQYDLTLSYYHDTGEAVSIGMGSDTSAYDAAEAVLEGVPYWVVGSCDAADIAAGTGCVFLRESAWSKLSKLVGVASMEVDSEIVVSNLYGVTDRRLCLLAHVGSDEAKRRFDWGNDLTEVKRTPDPGPYYCRVVPLGKGDTEYADDDETTYEYPIDITEETGTPGHPGPYWIEDAEAALAFRRSDGNGGWIYPTIAVNYDEDDPELLLAAAQDDLHNHTRPGVTYEASVVQLARAGMDVHGVELGDDVQVVDYGFNEDAALRIQGRVVKIEVDELSPETSTQLTIGQLRDSITNTIGSTLDDLGNAVSEASRIVAGMTTAKYIDELVGRLNREINATGGYTYLVPGEGTVTYDVAVSDPLVGSEASQVVQMKGGSIRIANSKLSGFSGINDWDWKTVFTAGHIAASVVSAANLRAGYISNADGNNYWNLDNGRFELGFTMNTILSSDTLSISSYKTLSDQIPSQSVTGNTDYLIRFSTTHTPTRELWIVLGYFRQYTVATTTQIDYTCGSTKVSPTITSTASGIKHYEAIVSLGQKTEHPSGTNLGWRVAFVYGLIDNPYSRPWSDEAYTVSDLEVIRLPNEGAGAINLLARNEDDTEAASTIITAESMHMTHDDRHTVVSAGVITLGDGDYPAEVELSKNGKIFYDPDDDSLYFGNMTNSPYRGETVARVSFSQTGSNLLPGRLDRIGMLLYEATGSDVVSTYGTNISDQYSSYIRAFRWGPVIEIDCDLRVTGTIPVHTSNVTLLYLKSEWVPYNSTDVEVVGSIGSTPTRITIQGGYNSGIIARIDGDLYEQTIDSGTHIRLHATYLRVYTSTYGD